VYLFRPFDKRAGWARHVGRVLRPILRQTSSLP
jgi:hypothetical protein